MTTTRDKGTLDAELPVVSLRDIAFYAREGKRRRDEEISKLFRAVGRGVARLGRAVARLATERGRGIGAMIPPPGGLGQPTR